LNWKKFCELWKSSYSWKRTYGKKKWSMDSRRINNEYKFIYRIENNNI